METIKPSSTLLFVNAEKDFKEEESLKNIYDITDEFYIEVVVDDLNTYEKSEGRLSMLRDKIGFERLKGAL